MNPKEPRKSVSHDNECSRCEFEIIKRKRIHWRGGVRRQVSRARRGVMRAAKFVARRAVMNGIHDVALHARPVVQADGPIIAFRLASMTCMERAQNISSVTNRRNNAVTIQKNECARLHGQQ